MADLAVTNSFSAGTTIQASQMNTNFTDITGWANGTPNLGVSGSATTVDGTLTVDEAATLTGGVTIGTATPIVLEGASADAYETTIAVTDPTADRTVTLPDSSGTVAYTSNTVPSAGGSFTGAVEFGSDGSGVDVTFHSDTGSDLMFWDSSAESLTITGTDGQDALVVADGDVSITDKLTVTGQIVTHLLVSTESGTTHAPALGDENAYILTTHGTGITVTLPQNSAQAFAIGTTIYYERNGAGTLTFAAGTGASITSKDSTLTCGDRYTAVCALKIGTNAWSLIGNIA